MKQTIFLIGCCISAIGCILGIFLNNLFFGLTLVGLIIAGLVIRNLDKDE